jgi:hypothetical protein
MTEDFCKRTTRRNIKLGYAPKEAARLSKFCYVSMMSVSGMMVAMLDPSMKSLAGDGDESPRCLSAGAPSDVLSLLNRWYGQDQGDALTPRTRFSEIQRRLPAL